MHLLRVVWKFCLLKGLENFLDIGQVCQINYYLLFAISWNTDIPNELKELLIELRRVQEK